MFQLFGLDRLKKIQPVGVFGQDTLTAGAIAARQIIDSSHAILSVNSELNKPIGDFVIVGYTVPANSIFELTNLCFLWSGAGTITFCLNLALRGATVITLNSTPALAGLTSFGFSGKVMLAAGDVVETQYHVSVANVNPSINVCGVLWPQP